MKLRNRLHAGAQWLAGLVLLLTFAPASVPAQSSFTWDGGDGSSLLWSTPGNWNPDGAPADLFNADFFFGGTLNTGTVGAPLNNDLLTGTISNLTFTAGASSFYLGGNTFTNRGSLTNLSGMGQHLSAGMVMGAGTAHVLNLGTAPLTLAGQITAPASVSSLAKMGTGTLYFTSPLTNTLANGQPGGGGTAFTAGFNVDEGAVVFDGGPTSVYNLPSSSEAALGRAGVTGNKDVTVTFQSGTFGAGSWIALGRGNGAGEVSSDLILNGDARVNAVNFSAGYNAGDAGRLPRGSITLNGASGLRVSSTGNNAMMIAESPGSVFTCDVNDSAGLTNSGTGNATLRIASAGRGVLRLNSPTATVSVWRMAFGWSAGSAGAFYNRGTFLLNSGAAVEHFPIGAGSGGATPANNAYGYYLHDSPVLAGLKEIGVGGSGGGNGVLEVKSGTVHVTNWITICRSGGTTVGAEQTALLLVRGGTINAPNSEQFRYLWSGSGMTEYGYVDVGAGGKIGSLGPNSAIDLAQSANALSTAVLTIGNGGRAEVGRIFAAQTAPNTVVNFNGATLSATRSIATFLGGNLDAVHIHAGGLTVDTAGFDVTAVPPLAAPYDQGILAIPVATPGAGYIGRPIVRITGGGGLGATAVAEWNEAAGTITGITITCPGSGYFEAPAVALIGGGPTTAATLGAPTLGSVGSGGLTKTGAGTLTLAGGSTYTGPTTITGGTLSLVPSLTYPGTPGALSISNAALTLDVSGGFSSLPAGTVTLQHNTTLNLNYGTVSFNPFLAAIAASGDLAAPGTNIVINVSGFGLQVGQFPILSYTGVGPASLANFSLGSLPPGVTASLVNNTGSKTVDLNVTATGQNLTWYGSSSALWDINTSPNWNFGGAFYLEYGAGANIVGDPVRFDDTVYNDYVNPPATNVNLTTILRPFTVVVDSSMYPYGFTGAGRLSGQGNLIKSNAATLTLGTSNDYTGGTFLYGGTTVISNNAALGAPAGGLTLGGGGLQVAANTATTRPINVHADTPLIVDPGVTAQIGSVLSGTSRLLVRGGGTTTLTNATRLQFHVNQGTLVLEGNAKATNTTSFSSVGVTTGESGRMIVRGNATFDCNQDLNFGDVNDATGRLDIQDNAIVRSMNFWAGKWNTSTGYVYQAGGLFTNSPSGGADWRVGGQDAAAVGSFGSYNLSGGRLDVTKNFQIGAYGYGEMNITGGAWNQWAGFPVLGRFTNGVGVLNITGGQFNQLNTGTFFIVGEQGTGTLNLGGTGVVTLTNALRLAHAGNGVGVLNLNAGGRLITPGIVATGPGLSASVNLNGGTLQPTANTASFLQGLTAATVLAGGAVLDTDGKDITIAQELLDGGGGLTKNGAGTLQLSGICRYSGPTAVNAGRLYVLPSQFLGSGAITVADNATFGAVVLSPGVVTVNGLTLGSAGASTLAFTMGTNGNPATAVLKVGTLTLNGTPSVVLAGKFTVGTFPLVRYGSLGGSGAFNPVVAGPQGLVASLSNHVASSTFYVTVSSLGPGIVWTGTNSNPVLTNLWDLNATTNWTVSGVPTYYAELSPPGDAVTFDDTGSGVVLLNTNANPSGILISNLTKPYAFHGAGRLAGQGGLTKKGAAAVTMGLAGNDYEGDTQIEAGTYYLGSPTAIPDGAGRGNLILGSAARLELAGNSEAVNGLSGAGAINNDNETNVVLTVGNGDASAAWSGTINNTGGGGVSLIKNGGGAWVVRGANYLNAPVQASAQVNGGILILTNGGRMEALSGELWIAQNATTGTVVVAGGTLLADNNWIAIGRNNPLADGTLIVNSGTVQKAGGNNIVLGSLGATGRLIVNGGQVLNNGMLWVGEGATANGYVYLNGGWLQATQVRSNNNGGIPVRSEVYLNGGTLQATANQADYFQCAAFVQANGFTFDDGGFSVTLATAPLMEDPASPGGGMTKTGAGRLNLNTSNTYLGLTRVNQGTLGGVGSLLGPLTVAAGGNLAPGVAGTTVGAFTLAGQPLTLQGNASFRIRKVGGLPENDLVTGISTANYGGTLTVSNLTAEPLVVGDQFPLFSAASAAGNFTAIVGSPGPGLGYEFVPASGVLKIVTGVASNPTNISYSVSGGSLTITWPATHLGWILQAQTNSLSVGLANNWVDIPGTASATQAVIAMDPTKPTVFFRLRKP